MPDDGRNLGLEAARGVAAIMVALAHANMWSPVKPLGGFFAAGTSGVDFFFVLSGFLIPHAYRTRIGQRAHLTDYLWRRFARIFPPYWAVTLLTLPTALAVTAFRPDIVWSIDYAISNLFLLPDGRYPIVAPAWSLQNEVFFYVMFATAFFSRLIAAQLFVVWFALILLGFLIELPEALKAIAMPINLEFFFGMGLALTGFRGSWRIALVGASAFVGTMVAQTAGVPVWGELAVTPLGRTLLYGGASTAIVAGLLGYDVRGRLARWLGDLSYPLYLVHFPMMAALVLLGMRPRGWLFLAAHLGVALVAAIVFRQLVEAPILAYLRQRISGGTAARQAGFARGS